MGGWLWEVRGGVFGVQPRSMCLSAAGALWGPWASAWGGWTPAIVLLGPFLERLQQGSQAGGGLGLGKL